MKSQSVSVRNTKLCRVCDSWVVLSARGLCQPCEQWLRPRAVSRAVALTEVWLDAQAQFYGQPTVSQARLRLYGIVGTALAAVGIGMLAVEYWRVW